MPAHRQSDDILQLTLMSGGAGSVLASPRIVVRLAAGSRGRLLLDHVDDGASEHFTNAVLDVELAEHAQLTVYRLQRQCDRAFHIERVEARVGDGASFVLRDSQLGGSLSRLDVRVGLDGRAANAEVTGVFLADGSRHLDTHILIDHRGEDTTSLQDYRGIAANKGRGVFNGKTIVHPGAQKSNARQVHRKLLLTTGAEIDTKPDLEIYADDVQCSHGTTTGQLDLLPSSTCARAGSVNRRPAAPSPAPSPAPCWRAWTSPRSARCARRTRPAPRAPAGGDRMSAVTALPTAADTLDVAAIRSANSRSSTAPCTASRCRTSTTRPRPEPAGGDRRDVALLREHPRQHAPRRPHAEPGGHRPFEGAREKVRRFINARRRARDHLRARHHRGDQPRGADLRPDAARRPATRS